MQDKAPKRCRLEGGFKKKVAPKAIKGERIMQEIASEIHVHPVQECERKKWGLEEASKQELSWTSCARKRKNSNGWCAKGRMSWSGCEKIQSSRISEQ